MVFWLVYSQSDTKDQSREILIYAKIFFQESALENVTNYMSAILLSVIDLGQHCFR